MSGTGIDICDSCVVVDIVKETNTIPACNRPPLWSSPSTWFVVFIYCDDLRDIFRTWVGFGLRQVLPIQSISWHYMLLDFFTLRGTDYDRLLFRAGWRSNKPASFDMVTQKLYGTRKCSNSGCFKTFREIDNTPSSCLCHGGKMKGSRKLSCCGAAKFSDRGCKTCYHSGAYFEFVHQPRDPNVPGNAIKLPMVIAANEQPKSQDHRSKADSISSQMALSTPSLPPIVLLASASPRSP
jgi:hypothetical protein